MTYPPQPPYGHQPEGYGQQPGGYEPQQPAWGQPNYGTPPAGSEQPTGSDQPAAGQPAAGQPTGGLPGAGQPPYGQTGYTQPWPGQPVGQPGYGVPPGYGIPSGFGAPPPRRGNTGLIIGLVIAIVVVLGGASVGGYFLFFSHSETSSVATPKTTTPVKPADPLANPGTIDPCSGFTSSTFTSIGTASLAPSGFSNCRIVVTPFGGSDSVLLHVDYSSDIDISDIDTSRFTVTKQGSLQVVSQIDKSNTDDCYGNVYENDTESVLVHALPSSRNSGDVDLCEATDTAVQAVVVLIRTNQIKHLSYPSSSLAKVNACAVLDPSTVAAAIGGSEQVVADEYPGDHVCSWGVGTDTDQDQPNVFLFEELFSVPDASTDFPDETEQTIAGRDTFLYPNPSSSTDTSLSECFADTAVKHWNSWPGQTAGTDSSRTEYAELDVMVSGTTEDACKAAAALAAKAWPKLPPVS